MEKLEGIVTKSTGSWYRVLAEDQNFYDCRIKGKFRLDNLKSTNPVAVGDKVIFHWDEKLKSAVIDTILDRKNYLVRKSPNLSKQTHIIAANIDYSLLIVSLKQPRISAAFIDRFTVISLAYEIEPVIIFNKVDIYNSKEQDYLLELLELYSGLGFINMAISALEGKNIDSVKKILSGKTSLLAGQSGVGKSSILNKINPELNIKTKEISKNTKKGQHATTFYEMYRLEKDTFVIDSPGIKELGLHDFESWEVGLFFPEIKERATNCKFNTCLHVQEPGCAVLEALEKGEITEGRYINYLKILDDFEK